MLEGVVLAGGRGERFWPLSRRRRPKQLLRLLGEQSLLRATWTRLRERLAPEAIWLTAGAELADAIHEELPELPARRLVPESIGRNTAPAAAVAAALGARDGDPVQIVAPSDHWIPDPAAFWAAAERAIETAQAADGPLVTLGISISHPATGYGYIERGAPRSDDGKVFAAERFHEKPDHETALRYQRSGRCYWNSGIFVWRAQAFLAEVERHMPALHAAVAPLLEASDPMTLLPGVFDRAPSDSVDFGVLEKSERVAVVAADFAWSDLGSWASWGELAGRDDRGNATHGEVVTIDSSGCVLYADEGMIATLGVRDLVVVRVGDVTLVADPERSQEVRKILEQLREQEDGSRHL